MIRCLLVSIALLAFAPCGSLASQTSGAAPGNYAKRADVAEFIAQMVQRHSFVASELHRLFSKARHRQAIIRAMSPPAEARVRSWHAYRDLFVNRERIDAGVSFLKRHRAALARAVQEFGIPAEIIVAIIGVETVYGRNTGAHRVIDALATLAFDYPPRADFFRDELEQFLLYARENGIDVLAARGSYAGAFGIPQFMPGSYRRYALDYDGDGRSDLNSSPADAIGSVANYLGAHGWGTGQPIAERALVSGKAFRALIDAGIRPVFRVADLPAYGVTVRSENPAIELPPDAGCALIELETPGRPSEYWIGLRNFYVLTRYNRSSFYAIAVLELARAIAAEKPS